MERRSSSTMNRASARSLRELIEIADQDESCGSEYDNSNSNLNSSNSNLNFNDSNGDNGVGLSPGGRSQPFQNTSAASIASSPRPGLRRAPVARRNVTEVNLTEVAQAFELGVKVRANKDNEGGDDRPTFIGSDSVDWLLQTEFASSRGEAEDLGKRLLQEIHLFEQNPKGQGGRTNDFLDDLIYYSFRDPSERTYPKASGFGGAVGVCDDGDADGLGTGPSAGGNLHHRLDASRPAANSDVGGLRPLASAIDLGGGSLDAIPRPRLMTRQSMICLSPGMSAMGGGTGNNLSSLARIGSLANSAKSIADCSKEQLVHLGKLFRFGVPTRTHVYRNYQYRNCFIGAKAVDWMVFSSLAKTRREAIQLGQRFEKELELFHHAQLQDDEEPKQGFKDDKIFYRFSDDVEGPAVVPLAGAPDKPIRRQSFQPAGEAFRRFSLMRQTSAQGDMSSAAAAAAASFKFSSLGDFSDDEIDITSPPPTLRRQDIELKSPFLVRSSSLARQQQRKGGEGGRGLAPVAEPPSHLRESTLRDSMNEFEAQIRKDLKEEELEELEAKPSNGMPLIESKKELEHERRKQFVYPKAVNLPYSQDGTALEEETKTNGSALSVASDDGFEISYEEKMAYLGFRLRHWASSFRRLDPRQQIFRFFNLIKQIREEIKEIEEDHINHLVKRLHTMDVPYISPRLYSFSKASIFTVWRPTSLPAIRKMVMGQAVGKGLDIKGKSAKRGKLSAFVPFLQISENHHKDKVRTLPTSGTVRVFFSTKLARDSVAMVLEEVVGEEMMQMVEDAKEMLEQIVDDADEGHNDGAAADWEQVQRALGCEIDDTTVHALDDYAPQCYGLDIPVRLFWEAFVVRQDISRPKGSQYDTGRPSIPAFQDKNTETLLKPPKEGAPRAVLWQNSDPDSDTSFSPFELLMAYEEHGGVFPVVSDFDGFLLGSQRVSFHKPLPPDQVQVLKWMVDRIEGILDNPGPESWTTRWLEVLENPWQGEDMPKYKPMQYGFGDPISYNIMEKAAIAMVSGKIRNGAVRHGAECFNYSFPQDLDDEFLVISESLSDGVDENGNPKPSSKQWTYMDPTGLQAFLSDRIREGYTFPLNPKWILCDGWGHLFDQLLASDRAEVQDSLNTWYPPESGIREKIASIRKRHPNGFKREKRVKTLADVDPSILADIVAIEASNTVPGSSSATGVTALLSALAPDVEEEVISNTTTLVASLLKKVPLNRSRAVELERSMANFFFCLDEFLTNLVIQRNILYTIEQMVSVHLEGVIGDGAGFRAKSVLGAICDSLAVHGQDVDVVQNACKILTGILPSIQEAAMDENTISVLGTALLQVLEDNLRTVELQECGLETWNACCAKSDIFKLMLINSYGVELVVKAMEKYKDTPKIQGRGCAIIAKLSSIYEGRAQIGERGVVFPVVNAMILHPESTSLQTEALSSLAHLAQFSSNNQYIAASGAEDAVLYAIWINLRDPKVVVNALKALNNIAVDEDTRSVAKMRKLTISIVVVAMQRNQANEELQRVALFLLDSYTQQRENMSLIKGSLDTLYVLLFSASENHPKACRSVAERILGRLEKINYY